MKQRLGIAQALLGRPKLLICDEPTSALDPIGRKEILDILLSVKDQTTVLFSTHILSDVERICSNVAFLHGGKIVLQGSVSELKKLHPSQEFSVTPIDPQAISLILHDIANGKSMDGEKIVFTGDDEKLFEVLDYLARHRIAVSEIQKAEPTLENLFMEVVG